MKKTLITLLILLAPSVVFASSAELLVDTGNAEVNALEATVHLPEGFSVKNVDSGHSAILFWIKSPTYDPALRTISFSGIAPGGFHGRKTILSINGEFSNDELLRLTFSNVQALKNDGLGTSVPATFSLRPAKTANDTTAPEDFQPTIGQSDSVFDGRYFVVFATQDKGVGIDHYEIKEGYLSSWITAESPYPLESQLLDKDIYVKAVDRAGNERVATLKALHVKEWYRQYVSLAILLVVIVLFLYFKRLWRKIIT